MISYFRPVEDFPSRLTAQRGRIEDTPNPRAKKHLFSALRSEESFRIGLVRSSLGNSTVIGQMYEPNGWMRRCNPFLFGILHSCRTSRGERNEILSMRRRHRALFELRQTSIS
jgi:hypothetical protein